MINDNKPMDCRFCKKAYGDIHQPPGFWTCKKCDKIYTKLAKRGREIINEFREFCKKNYIEINDNQIILRQDEVGVFFWFDPVKEQTPPKEVSMVTPTVLYPIVEGGETTAVTS